MAKNTEFPRFMWHPVSGIRVLCKDAADMIEGYLDHHPADVAKGGTAIPDTGMTRADVMAALDTGAVAYDAAASDAELRAILQGALTMELRARGVEVAANATLESLYKLL